MSWPLRPPWSIDGRPGNVTLGTPVGRGGEATVHELPGIPGTVAKVYQQPTAEHEAKLRAMIGRAPADLPAAGGHVPLAWPEALLLDGNGRMGGFVMPRLDPGAHRPLLQLYHPGSRRANAPGVGWLYLVRAARNLSSLLTSLHAAGYVVGDLNESNILLTPRALVSLIDLDSIQVRDGRTVYRCPVGKLDYTPPELIGKNFRQVNRAPASDVFALGVIVFQLLMEGSHPFAGVWQGPGEPPGLESHIRARRSAHFGGRHVEPPPAAPPVRNLPPGLRRTLRNTFISPAFARPSAANIRDALGALEASLKTCSVNPLHAYSGHLKDCPWCRRKALLGSDPFI